MDSGRSVDAGRLWSGGVLAGVVAAGVAVVGLLVVRGILDIPVLVSRSGELVSPSTWWYAGAAFLAAVVATGLMHLLLVVAPQPFRFFGWIYGLGVAIAVLVPLTLDVGLKSKLSAALINLVIGVCIGSIVGGVGRSAFHVQRTAPGAAQGPWSRDWS